ncbi:uncharacterized protein FIBRA_01788 [Fibroporia radiculosa]|uniref:Uncharacterized protein n=1 Tax=Fibroporia radiculosa TaxID=599839 RepID=J4I8P4_9APHY|nr:uncharacterized protein FIBRA_01788 [Fibroporia radiculosa]CCL99766.1 predicted protein [Fibroporia radiculosa]
MSVLSEINSYAVFDDQSPADIRYSGPWVHYTLSGNEQVWNQTLTSATSTSCSLSWNFSGVVGTVLPANGTTPPTTLYSIDGASPSTYTPPLNITERRDRQLFFTSDALSDGEHTLTITVTSVDGGNDPFLLDFFFLATTSNSPTATYISMAIPSTSSSAMANISTSSTDSMGAVVGGVVGGLALLVMTLLGMIFIYRRRRGNGADYHSVVDDDLKPFLPVPYITSSERAHQTSSRESMETVPIITPIAPSTITVEPPQSLAGDVDYTARQDTWPQAGGRSRKNVRTEPFSTARPPSPGFVNLGLPSPSVQSTTPAELPPAYSEGDSTQII